MSKNTEGLFRIGGQHGLYSHKEQKGMIKCEYMWKHHPTGKSGKTTMWVSTISDLFYLCRVWSESQPTNWFYMPLTFK